MDIRRSRQRATMLRARVGIAFLIILLVAGACTRKRTARHRRRRHPRDVAAAPTPPPVYPDTRIRRVAALIGKTKQAVVQTLGPPTEPVFDGQSFGYRQGDWKAFFVFEDPEHEKSLFGTQTRGAAATVRSLLIRFDWKPEIRVVLKSLDAPEQPAYMRVGRERLAWQLQNLPQVHGYRVAFGGVQAAGNAYQVVATCSVPPLTGTPTFNYQTNRSEIATLSPNPAFVWSGCTPTAVLLNAAKDFAGYRGYDDAEGLSDYVALNGAPSSVSP